MALASRQLVAMRPAVNLGAPSNVVKTLVHHTPASSGFSPSSSATLRLGSPLQMQLQTLSRSFSASSSSSSSSSPSSPATSPSPSHTPDAASPVLSWDRYLRLRKQRRIAGIATSVPTTAFAALASGSYFLTQEIDPTASPMFGIDPVYVYALLTLGCTGLGYLTGPSLGSSLWALLHAKDRANIDAKDKIFYQHIVRNRVDPSRQTMQNRLPDYYGEKIGSLKDYRQWLRDQATFRRKAAHGVDGDLHNV